MKSKSETIFQQWYKKRRSVRRDLDPRSPYWLLGGAGLGVVLWQAASPPDSWAHALLHQRGVIQPIIMVAGGMVFGFLLAKAILLTREINAHHQSGIFKLKDASRQTAEMVLSMSEQGRSLLALRTSKLLTLWINSGSTTQVERTLDNDTEAYDLAYQASYVLPKILIWAVPVLGFIGTVLGIGKAIGSFEEFISQVEDINVLRDGLIKVTEGLGTAFDTTFLALTGNL